MKAINCKQLQHTTDIEQYSKLLLTIPRMIHHMVETARQLLACSDLPEGSSTPSLILSAVDRQGLQCDCLARKFLHTTLAFNIQLSHMAASSVY
jgi:hypothetical protein